MRVGIRGMLPEKVDPELLAVDHDEGGELRTRRWRSASCATCPRLDTKTLLKEAKVPVRCINAGARVSSSPSRRPVDVNKKYADFKVVIMEGVGHFPMLEKPVEFNEKLREVLKEFGH